MGAGGTTRVLVVDDDQTTLEVVATALGDEFEVRDAPNGAVGLERVLTFKPDVIVFDFWMPVLGGRELVHGIREVARTRVGLVAMSGTPEVEDWCTRVGVAAFLKKPFDAAQLRAAVSRALEDARRSSSSGFPSMREASSTSSARRLRIDRAVLVVAPEDEVALLRALLRAGEVPMQVAAVATVSEAVKALGSIAVDAVCVCGAKLLEDPEIMALVAASKSRGVPFVVEANPSLELRNHAAVRVSLEPGLACVARTLKEAVGAR
jgi:two-component system chemotaxis response regulator CheY